MQILQLLNCVLCVNIAITKVRIIWFSCVFHVAFYYCVCYTVIERGVFHDFQKKNI